jgi:hypothetical protein
MDREPISTGRLPAPGGCQATISANIGVDLPMPENPPWPRRDSGRLGDGIFRQPAIRSAVSAADAAARWRGARPFDGRPGASRLLGGRCRATCPRC